MTSVFIPFAFSRAEAEREGALLEAVEEKEGDEEAFEEAFEEKDVVEEEEGEGSISLESSTSGTSGRSATVSSKGEEADDDGEEEDEDEDGEREAGVGDAEEGDDFVDLVGELFLKEDFLVDFVLVLVVEAEVEDAEDGVPTTGATDGVPTTGATGGNGFAFFVLREAFFVVEDDGVEEDGTEVVDSNEGEDEEVVVEGVTEEDEVSMSAVLTLGESDLSTSCLGTGGSASSEVDWDGFSVPVRRA
jgi:hypothetical protein